jgi:prophage maintenance system killer protein
MLNDNALSSFQVGISNDHCFKINFNKMYRFSIASVFLDFVGNTFIAPFPEVKLQISQTSDLQKNYRFQFYQTLP